ncbi:DUF4360 domain-containing protein [Actinomadura meridiana]|uniref:DUF4360 domain-containing protein n=1 Tax=Actinomadura meridiana TaxID=559626 RepID=A0ABP8CEM2_9ACTN
MRRGFAISAVAAAALAVSTAPIAAAASGPRPVRGPDGVTIEIATANGSGCLNNTAGVAISDDAESFTVWYFNYLVQSGGSLKPAPVRKNCQLSLKLRAPEGVTYAVSSVDHRGYASLVDGAKATQKVSHYFQGLPQTGRITHQIPVPFDGTWHFEDSIQTEPVYKPCGEDRNLNLNTELRLDPGTSDPSHPSVIAMDTLEDPIGSIYHLTWKTCP